MLLYNHYVYNSYYKDNNSEAYSFIVDLNKNDTIDIYNDSSEMLNFNTLARTIIDTPIIDNKSFYDYLYEYLARNNNIDNILKSHKIVKVDNTLSINNGNMIIVLDSNDLYFGYSMFVIFSALNYIKEYNIQNYIKPMDIDWMVK